ncbi:FecCD family ABC transporter permease [Magnetospirillum sulfuroxidans]|uniref:Iron ABC transporter permease n=1 Tax=Magnetospirillum sulfuroxidans TaxID=611300 RepID=A0ABS5IB35_9PROT|nr:iron ABC transporter permease [Magnetospirillum sulfuroxidans]MBR9971476.1 iron ABC transporter permease [Magnetospirillum sulfuroxidans]
MIRLAFIILPLAVLAVALLALALGSSAIPMTAVALWPWDAAALSDQQRLIIENIRLPRMVLGLLVGAMLAVAGAALQGIFRNPLADPGLIGVSGGAALGAAAMIVMGGDRFVGPLALPLAAFAGAVIATLAVYGLGRRHGMISPPSMLLAGIAVNALAGAGIGVFSYVGDDLQLRQLTFWTMGSLGAAGWSTLLPSLVPMLASMAGLFLLATRLDVFSLGEREAFHLGLNPHRMVQLVVGLTCLGVGAAVAAAGPIGFIGLVVPHLIRLSLGAGHRVLLPAGMMLGAVLLVGADTIARIVAAPAELPVGLLCSLLGAPFFLWLLRR